MKTLVSFFFVVIAMVFVIPLTVNARVESAETANTAGSRLKDAVLPVYVPGKHVYYPQRPEGQQGPRIYDISRCLSAEQLAGLESRLTDFERQTGVDIDIFLCVGEGANRQDILEIERKVFDNLESKDGAQRMVIFFCFNVTKESGEMGSLINCHPQKIVKILPDPDRVKKEIWEKWAGLKQKGDPTAISRITEALDSFQDGISSSRSRQAASNP